ncbi:MAG: HD-GYP domain-containing protein [Lachnospiraceae bacterium]|nr:HD-GYP domain-containing protein [Lachnospiraceae bacterium]
MNISRRRIGSMLLYSILLLTYFLDLALVIVFSRSDNIIMINGDFLPISSFAGVFSSLANIIIIVIVVLFKKRGFITALILLFVQFPGFAVTTLIFRNLNSIQGFFSNLFTIIAVIFIYTRSVKLERYQANEIERLKERQMFSQHLFEQTATSLVNAIDAKDTYSHGHSLRVAEYSERIARAMGKDDEECYRIYYAALLHDVGKIGISDSIINKPGKLTPEEYDEIKTHPSVGNQILSSISEYPYLSIGAHFHHERYDGKGYPKGLKGDDIPEIARIISVADAYDAMSSNRSYRDAIPQQLVREEIIKGAGTQFDPVIASIMQRLIDQDTEYRMKERNAVRELAGNNELHCDKFRSSVSDGIIITGNITKIHLKYESKAPGGTEGRLPVIILFDSLDSRVHEDAKTVKELNYCEYCDIWFDGEIIDYNTRKIKSEIIEHEARKDAVQRQNDSIEFDVEAVKFKDHVLIRIDDGLKTIETTIALEDSSRYVYIGLSGENCLLSDVSIEKSFEPIGEDYIPRIAEGISFISGPEGDLPSIQIDGHRTETTDGVPVTNGMRLTFHSISLPTARLIWHCPYVVLYYSEDKLVHGKDYREYAALRLDGETIDGDTPAKIKVIAYKDDEFQGWDAWKKINMEGIDCEIMFTRNGNKITILTENIGMTVKCTVEIIDGTEDIYVALTGDQCALTNIRISK